MKNVPGLSYAGVAMVLHTQVHAAVNAGIPLDRILSHEGMSQESWERADGAWQDALADSAEGDLQLVESWDAALAQAATRFSRRIRPLDERLEAWLDFVRHIQSQDDFMAALSSHKVATSDWLHLQTFWNARLAADAGLRQKAAERLAAPPGPLPKLEIDPVQLPPPVNTGAVSPDPDASEFDAGDDERDPQDEREEEPVLDADANQAKPPLPAFEVPQGSAAQAAPSPIRQPEGNSDEAAQIPEYLRSHPVNPPGSAAYFVQPALAQPVVQPLPPSELPDFLRPVAASHSSSLAAAAASQPVAFEQPTPPPVAPPEASVVPLAAVAVVPIVSSHPPAVVPMGPAVLPTPSSGEGAPPPLPPAVAMPALPLAPPAAVYAAPLPPAVAMPAVPMAAPAAVHAAPLPPPPVVAVSQELPSRAPLVEASASPLGISTDQALPNFGPPPPGRSPSHGATGHNASRANPGSMGAADSAGTMVVSQLPAELLARMAAPSTPSSSASPAAVQPPAVSASAAVPAAAQRLAVPAAAQRLAVPAAVQPPAVSAIAAVPAAAQRLSVPAAVQPPAVPVIAAVPAVASVVKAPPLVVQPISPGVPGLTPELKPLAKLPWET